MSFSRPRRMNPLRVPPEPPTPLASRESSKKVIEYYDSDDSGLSYDADDDRGGRDNGDEKTRTSEDEENFDAYRLYSVSWPHRATTPMNSEFLWLAPSSQGIPSYGSLMINNAPHSRQHSARRIPANLTKQELPYDVGTPECLMDITKPAVHHNHWRRRHKRHKSLPKFQTPEISSDAHQRKQSARHSSVYNKVSSLKKPPSTSTKFLSADCSNSPFLHMNAHHAAHSSSLCEKSPSRTYTSSQRHLSNTPAQDVTSAAKNHRSDQFLQQVTNSTVLSPPISGIVTGTTLLNHAGTDHGSMVVSHSPSSHHGQWFWRRSHHHSYASFLTSIQDMDQSMKKYLGTEQPAQCRGVTAAFLFLLQATLITVIGIVGISGAWKETWNTKIGCGQSCWALILLADTLLSGFFAITLCALVVYTMTISRRLLVQTALIASCKLSLLWGVLGVAAVAQASSSAGFFLSSYIPSTMGFLVCMACTGYTVVVWRHIPFSSANLHVALTAVSSVPYRLVWFMAFFFQILALIWSIFWTMAVIMVCQSCDYTARLDVKFLASIALLLISYFWTCQVFLNVVQVIVAKVVMKWWENNLEDELSEDAVTDGSRCCSLSPILRDSLRNATIYSFGSVCIGSLLVGPIQLVRQIMEKICPKYLQNDSPQDAATELTHNNEDEEMAPCAAKVTAASTSLGMLLSCHPLAYVYVSVYGYPFVEACEKSSALIHAKGWSAVILDDHLISNALFFTNLVIGGCCGCCEMFLIVEQLMAYNELDSSTAADTNNLTMMTYFIGLLIGIALSSIMMGVVLSAVHTIILCYASRPALSSRKAHPELSEELFQEYYDDQINLHQSHHIKHHQSHHIKHNQSHHK